MTTKAAELLDHPIDPVVIARGLGINVFEVPMSGDLSGWITNENPNYEATIFVNSEHAAVRQRFTVAHELGHYLEHVSTFGANTPMHYRRDADSACGSFGDEIRADRFAAELLMPEGRVRELVDAGYDEVTLPKKFGVSMAAMSNRLDDLKVRIQHRH